MSAVSVEMITQHMSLIRAMRQEIQKNPELQAPSFSWLRDRLEESGMKVAQFVGEQGLERFPGRLVTQEVDRYLIGSLNLIRTSKVGCKQALHDYIGRLLDIRSQYPVAPDERSQATTPSSPRPSPIAAAVISPSTVGPQSSSSQTSFFRSLSAEHLFGFFK